MMTIKHLEIHVYRSSAILPYYICQRGKVTAQIRIKRVKIKTRGEEVTADRNQCFQADSQLFILNLLHKNSFIWQGLNLKRSLNFMCKWTVTMDKTNLL